MKPSYFPLILGENKATFCKEGHINESQLTSSCERLLSPSESMSLKTLVGGGPSSTLISSTSKRRVAPAGILSPVGTKRRVSEKEVFERLQVASALECFTLTCILFVNIHRRAQKITRFRTRYFPIL